MVHTQIASRTMQWSMRSNSLGKAIELLLLIVQFAISDIIARHSFITATYVVRQWRTNEMATG